MHSVLTLEQVTKDLFDEHCKESEAWPDIHVIPLGILLARPDQALASNEIIPSLQYFHHRSGDHISFYCAGYGRYWPDIEKIDEYVEESLHPEEEMELLNYKRLTSDRVGVTNDRNPWYFSAKAFAEFIDDMEAYSTWKYSGAPELLLLNATNVEERFHFELDFTKVICINLSRAIKLGAIDDVHQLFEEIFRVAREKKASLRVEELSKSLSMDSFLEGASEILADLIPNNIMNKIVATASFKTHNWKPKK